MTTQQLNDLLPIVYNSLEIDDYKDMYAKGFVAYGALYIRLKAYYELVFDAV